MATRLAPVVCTDIESAEVLDVCDACRIRNDEPPAAVASATQATPEARVLGGDPALLADARMGTSRMAASRVGLARWVQRAGGNRAMTQLLAREDSDTATVDAPVKEALIEGGDVDRMLLEDPYFEPYVKPKMKKGIHAAGHVHLHDPESFKTAVLEYSRGGPSRERPGELMDDDEILRLEPQIRAFRDQGEIHCSEERADSSTVVHESMHLFSNRAIGVATNFRVNEGMTEYFTRKLCATYGIPRPALAYPDEFRTISKLVTATSEKLVADAYFLGKVKPLKHAVDRNKGFWAGLRGKNTDKRSGTWDSWVDLLTVGKFDEAEQLL